MKTYLKLSALSVLLFAHTFSQAGTIRSQKLIIECRNADSFVSRQLGGTHGGTDFLGSGKSTFSVYQDELGELTSKVEQHFIKGFSSIFNFEVSQMSNAKNVPIDHWLKDSFGKLNFVTSRHDILYFDLISQEANTLPVINAFFVTNGEYKGSGVLNFTVKGVFHNLPTAAEFSARLFKCKSVR